MLPSALFRHQRLLFTLLVVALGVAVPPAGADRGHDDPVYRAGSRITTDFDGRDDSIAALALQPDRKLVAAGTATVDGIIRFALARYLPDGTLDAKFGGGGTVTTLIGTASSARAIVVQPDGKLVVAGMATVAGDISGRFALARYLPDGRLDSGFGNGGTVITDFDSRPYTDLIHAAVLQPDGKVVVAGETMTGNIADSQYALARYLPDGQLDPSFDGDGKLTTEFGPGLDAAYTVVIQPDGKLVAAGRGTWCGPTLARYLPDGQLDPGFVRRDGTVRTSMCAANSAALDRDGNIVLAGGTLNSTLEFAVARYRPDGTPDRSFGENGEVATRVGRQAGAQAIALQPDGKVIAAGYGDVGSGRYTFAVARYLPDGRLDNSLDGDGIATTDFSPETDEASAVIITDDARIVAAGQAAFTSRQGSDFAIAGLGAALLDLDVTITPPSLGKGPGDIDLSDNTAPATINLVSPRPSPTPSVKSPPVTNDQRRTTVPSRPGRAPGARPPGNAPGGIGEPGDIPAQPPAAPMAVSTPDEQAAASARNVTAEWLRFSPAGSHRPALPESRAAMASLAIAAIASVAVGLALFHRQDRTRRIHPALTRSGLNL